MTSPILERLSKWRNVFAGWQLGTRPDTDPECQAVRDHRDATIRLRVEMNALVQLLIENRVFTLETWRKQLDIEAEYLNELYEQLFPGFRTTEAGGDGSSGGQRDHQELEALMQNIEQLCPVLADLIDEIAACDEESFPPNRKLQPEDKLVGVVRPAFSRKVFALSMFYDRNAEQARLDARYQVTEAQEDPGYKHSERADLLKEMFWYLARLELGAWVQNIGVRTGWQLVETHSHSQPPEFVRKLFGI